MGLSEPARAVWSKSADGDGRWLPLWQHMDDALHVATRLFDEWLPSNVSGLLADEFGGDVAAARAAVGFLAGAHDLGKATPAFAVQHDFLANRMGDYGLYMPTNKHDPERRSVPHALASHQLLIRWLEERGWPRKRARAWGVILGGHHGVPPDDVQEQITPQTNPSLYGTRLWKQVQDELVQWIAERSGAGERLYRWAEHSLSQRFQVLASGLVIVSDWIASNQDLFDYYAASLPPVTEHSERVAAALRGLRLPKPWQVRQPPESTVELFGSRFDLPKGATPRPVQHAVLDVCRQTREPGMVVIEAPMGEGKTEAALAAAEVLAAGSGAGGLHVALPTQATADAMFDRVVAWLDALGAQDQPVGGAITLSHGKARFNRLFRGMVRAGRLPDVGRDEHGDRAHAVVAHAWLSGRKKNQLANFAVGTIDQLLFAGLRSRHLMLRHLGLAGKVVLLDEIHAYDAYMNSYLATVLTWLGAYRVPVVALSATLPEQRRRELLEAYQAGRCGEADAGTGDASEQGTGSTPYPLITWTDGPRVEVRTVEASGRRTSMWVDWLDDEPDTLTTTLREELADGGCALVVRNTVARVLDSAAHLESAFPGEVIVAHSRFIIADRMVNDRELLDRFGPPGRARRRPERCIVVASQVVEQSLDVDFDLLVTDLAPIDLVLQRMGRSHRHQRGQGQDGRPPKLRTARTYITGADFEQSPPELEPGAERYVYHRYTLLRAAAVLRERFGATIELPGDIASLVQRAYGTEPLGPQEWQPAIDEAAQALRASTERREEKARRFQIETPGKPGKAIAGWLSAHAGEADEESAGRGQVRDGAPSLEAILVLSGADGVWRTPQWLEGDQAGLDVPRDEVPPEELAEVMTRCAIRLPLAFSNEKTEDELWEVTPEIWENSPLIYRMPVLVLSGDGTGRIGGRDVRYTRERGLEVVSDDG
ncbi:CRISPR-associated helicase Cas3' [Haloechinothrix sp. LS1_15]|uniref:CRISPR-associated helicase Cas3' n=1 Tax=Haloechinothrix sp. LS1_15 TaxID=2652248 RepID=UPI002945FDD5|nr:CRISPR-associated helicase Cas3' [Haloechinothrix sp. LS1_15]MDV6013056.1 CRISPR-associated helicase Cas3' [Haloechinothrix sp. LS1_15]